MKTKIAKGYNLKLQIQNIHEKKEKSYTQYSKKNSKAFNLKLHTNKMFMNKPHAYEHHWHFENLQNSNVKFVQKKLLERKILKCLW